MNRKALMLVEVSVLIIASMMIYMAVTKAMSEQNAVIERMAENNNVLLILDGMANKVKSDYDSGVDFGNRETLKGYNETLKDSHYRLTLEFTEDGNVVLVLSLMNSNMKDIIRRYRREVFLKNE